MIHTHQTRPTLYGLIAAASLLLLWGCDAEPEETAACPKTKGTICTWIGNGAVGFNGDGKALTESRLYWPVDVTFTSTGAYILDWNNHRVRRVTAENTLETVVGTDFIGDGPDDLSDLTSPGALGTTIHLNHPTQVVEMPDKKLLLVSWHNHKLRLFDPATGLAEVVCGRGAGFAGDGEGLEAVRLNQPSAVRLDAQGQVIILDQRNQRIRRLTSVSAGGTIETIAGTGTAGFSGDGGAPLSAEVNFPMGSNPPPGGGVALDAQGMIYFSDILNNRIRRLDLAANRIDTVLGDGETSTLNNPRDLEIGPDGRLYIADEFNHRVIALDLATNAVTVIAGTGAAGFAGDGAAATDAQLDRPSGVAFDEAGNLYISDTNNNRIRVVYAGE